MCGEAERWLGTAYPALHAEYLQHRSAPSSAPPVPTCLICCLRPHSGLHYGLHTCEGDKQFLKRTFHKRIVYSRCTEGTCEPRTRGWCQYCRLRRCLVSGINLNLVRVGEARVRRGAKRTRNHSTSARTQGQDLNKYDNSLSASRNGGIVNKRNVTKEETRGNMNERNAIKEKTQLKETGIVESTDMIVKKRKKAEENGNIVKLKKAGKNKTDIDVNSSMATYKNIINSELTSAQGIGQNKMITRSSSIDMYSSIKCSQNSSSNKKKTRRCNKCKNCLALNCKLCSACKNMKKYDGPGTKESCLRRSNCFNVCAPTLEKREERGGALQKNSHKYQLASKHWL